MRNFNSPYYFFIGDKNPFILLELSSRKETAVLEMERRGIFPGNGWELDALECFKHFIVEIVKAARDGRV